MKTHHCRIALVGGCWEGYPHPAGEETMKWKFLRGGSWVSRPHLTRVAHRSRSHPDRLWEDLGFRLVRRKP